MGVPLYIIRDTIRLNGPGLVVFAEALFETASLRVGDAVALRKADSSTLVTNIKEFPLINPSDAAGRVPMSFASEVDEEDVPAGTEVWSYP